MSRRRMVAAHSGMMTNSVPFTAIVSVDEIEEEQTRIFSRVFVENAVRDEPPRHRYVAISIPAFFDDEEDEGIDETTASWQRTAGLLLWGCTLSIIGAALFVATH